MSLVVFQHVDLLGELAAALLALVLLDALVELHVVPQSVLSLHACSRKDPLYDDPNSAVFLHRERR